VAGNRNRISAAAPRRARGLVDVVPIEPDPDDPAAPFAEGLWKNSYEAEQHLLHFGRSPDPVCWSQVGFASGYLSYCNGAEVICREVRCAAQGHDDCHTVGRFAEDWGDGVETERSYYRRDNLDALLDRLTSTLKRTEAELRSRQRKIAGIEAEPTEQTQLIARSQPMRRAIDTALRVAAVDSTILILGESGTGKERVARLIHQTSGRREGPFVSVNCAAMPENLLESELFGHVQGAFSGAAADRIGLFEAASGGTLFLDEVGETSPSMQSSLLRALQERRIRRVGESTDRAIDVRILAATNRELVRAVKEGQFREDLLYRLRVIEIRLPPLRERRDDVLELARAFIEQAAASTGRRVTGLAPEAADRLLRHDWPGNVRELENAMERAVVLCKGRRITSEDLPAELTSLSRTTGGRTLEQIEQQHILTVLEDNQGHRARTAAELGIGIATLYRKLKQLRC